MTAIRETQSLQGLGFVDAVPDATWLAIAEAQFAADPATAGRVHMVFDLASRSAAVGKFGWKARVPTLLQFAGDALLNEIGITSPGFRDEVCPQGDCHALAFNPTPALNDRKTAESRREHVIYRGSYRVIRRYRHDTTPHDVVDVFSP